MGFFSFLVLLAIAYLLWRVTDQLPDLIFRMSEIQRDVAEIRRTQTGAVDTATTPGPSTQPAESAPEAAASTENDSTGGATPS